MASAPFVCKACSPRSLGPSTLTVSTKTRVKWQLRIACSQMQNFGLDNVSQALQHIGDRLTRNDNFMRVGEFWKHNGEKNGQSQRVPNQGKEPLGFIFQFKEEHEEEGKLEYPYVSDHTFDTTTPKGELSPAAISCIEQFSRLYGCKGDQIMQEFHSQGTGSSLNEARHLVEYCCFKYNAGCGMEIHPQLKDASFRKLVFITMLAWQHPYVGAQDRGSDTEKQIVGEKAFVRIAPTFPGVADRATAHHLYEVLTEGEQGLSFNVWETYIVELLRVQEERLQHTQNEGARLDLDEEETIICVGASTQHPVQLWNSNNIAWPGRLTLTQKALYFEPNGMFQHQKAMKLDLSGGPWSLERTKVGPLGAPLFDNAVSVTSAAKSESWIIEFVNFSGDDERREVWFSFVNELVSAYTFIMEFGPEEDDPMLSYVRDSQNGNRRVLASVTNGIARFQAVQSTLKRSIAAPGRLLQFSRTSDHSSGDLVKEALAVSFWGGHVDTDQSSKNLSAESVITTDASGSGLHVTDIDGSIYLQRWMKSPTWRSSRSLSFWKQKAGVKGLILGRDLVVGDVSYLEKAVKKFKKQSRMVERTKATIDGALVQGIPSNIDLLKELMLPFTISFIHLRKLQKWENPQATLVFLASSLLVLYKGWLKYLLPFMLFTSAALVFALHSKKSQKKLGDGFGRVVIREQPPSNTLQKILALKEALAEVEVQIQNVNIGLLKLRNLLLAGHPLARNAVTFALLSAALILALVPFRYVCTFLLLDQFTCELDFRRGTVKKLARKVQGLWEAMPAARVVVLPYDEEKYDENGGSKIDTEVSDTSTPSEGEVMTEALREWVAESF